MINVKLDTMNELRRTHYCGEVPNEECEVVVCGFVQKIRDLGNLIFIDLRDRTGIVQLSFNDSTDRKIFEKAGSCHAEYVLMAKGNVKKRESVNKEIKTGEIEIIVTDLRVLSKAETPPFEVSKTDKVNDELKLKYRYLDLRNEKLQRNLIMRHNISKCAREYIRGTIEEVLEVAATCKGEMVIVTDGFKQDEVVFDMYTAITKVDEYIESGMRTKEAIGLVAKEMACKKNELYEAYHKR